MKIKEFKTWEEDSKVYVHISIEQWNEPRFPKARLETADVLTLLESKKIKVGICVKSATIKNWREHTSKATWIFEKKTVDKSKKQVTLKEEKPKTTRKQRTKKAPTED